MEGFSDLQWYDFMRLGTATLATIAFYRLLKLVMVDHPGYTTRLKEWAWVIFAVVFTLFTSPIEAVLNNTDYRYGALLSFLIAAAIVRAARPSPEPLQTFVPERKPKTS